MSTLLQDLRYAFRNLLKSRGFAVVGRRRAGARDRRQHRHLQHHRHHPAAAVAVSPSEQLLRLYETESAPGHYPFAGPDFLDWKAQNNTFQDMTLFGWPARHEPERQWAAGPRLGLPTEANFFSLLGVEPLLGRTWAAGEDQPGKDDVAILSYGLWQSRFAGDPGVVGQTLELNSQKTHDHRRDAGELPLSLAAQLWMPLEMDAKGLGTRGNHWANAIGRLKPGVTVESRAGGPDADRLAPGAAVSGFELQGGRRGGLAARRSGGQFPRFAGHDAGGGRAGAADRLRERGEPAARPGPWRGRRKWPCAARWALPGGGWFGNC